MKIILAAAMLAAFVSPAVAGHGYDHQLEAQVKRIVAAKIGDIRGTLSYDKVIVFPTAEQVFESPSIRTLQSMPVSSKPHFQVID
jgi:hypothetical protein